MKLRRGDVVIVDPLNKLRQVKIGSTIHGIVAKTTWRTAIVISLENYDVFRIPKSYLVKVPDKETRIQVVEREQIFSPKYTDLEIEFIMSLIHEQRQAGRSDVADVLESHILNKMQADRRNSNIRTSYNLHDRISTKPNIMYAIGDFVDSKTLKEWRAIAQITTEFANLMNGTRNSDLINNLNKTAVMSCDNKIISAVDDYFDGIPIDSHNIMACISELTETEEIQDIEPSFGDVVILAIGHAVDMAPAEERQALVEDLIIELADASLDNFMLQTIRDMYSNYNFGGFDE